MPSQQGFFCESVPVIELCLLECCRPAMTFSHFFFLSDELSDEHGPSERPSAALLQLSREVARKDS